MRLGLIGHPIGHSLSPWIHQQFLTETSIKGTYQLFEVAEKFVSEQIEQLKIMKLDGFNVTVPYKQTIIPFLDELDFHAKQIGAVNTVVRKDGKWIGYNTDGVGYVTALKSSYPDLFNGHKHVLVLGAGGASRGIFHALCQEKFETVDLANRTIAKATNLLTLNQTEQIKSCAYSFAQAEENLMHYDLIIQTTTVGMKPNVDEQVISMQRVKKDAIVSDIVYQPFMTRLLHDAKEHGATIHHGHEMLFYQAKLSFELWSGQVVEEKKILKDFIDKIID